METKKVGGRKTQDLMNESGSIFEKWEVDNIKENGAYIIRNNRHGKLMNIRLHQGKIEGCERNVLNVIVAAPAMLKALELIMKKGIDGFTDMKMREAIKAAKGE